MNAKEYQETISRYCVEYCMCGSTGEDLAEIRKAIRDDCRPSCPLYAVRPYKHTDERSTGGQIKGQIMFDLGAAEKKKKRQSTGMLKRNGKGSRTIIRQEGGGVNARKA